MAHRVKMLREQFNLKKKKLKSGKRDLQEYAIARKLDRNFRLIEFGVRPSQLVDIDPDGGVVPLD